MTEYLEYLALRCLEGIATRLSFRSASAVGAILGWLVHSATGFRRRITLENLGKAFPDRSAGELRRIARGAYRNYGIAIMHMLWAGGQPPERLLPAVRPINKHIVDDCLARGKGLILLSGHYGAWELLATSLRLHLGRPVAMIVQHQRNEMIDARVDANRRRFGNTTIPMGPSVREALKTLHEGNILLMLGDQSGPKEAVFIDFFGRPAATHRGAAAFSLKTGAPIVMCFLIRKPDETYDGVFEEVDSTGLTDTEEGVVELTRRHTFLLEKYIRMYPDHWLWMHKRWKHTQHYKSHTAIGEAT